MMLEGDVSLEGQGTARQTDVIVMAHRGLHVPHADVTHNASLTFAQWLQAVLGTNKAVKVSAASERDKTKKLAKCVSMSACLHVCLSQLIKIDDDFVLRST